MNGSKLTYLEDDCNDRKDTARYDMLHKMIMSSTPFSATGVSNSHLIRRHDNAIRSNPLALALAVAASVSFKLEKLDHRIISIINAVSNRSAQHNVFGKIEAQSLIEAHALVLGLARGMSRDCAHVDQCVILPFA